VYHIVEARIREALAAFLERRGVTGVVIATQRPPNVALGEVATPVAFELAKRLRRAPRQIAQQIATELAGIPGVTRIEIAGAGYVNFFLDRPAFFAAAMIGSKTTSTAQTPGRQRPTHRKLSSSTPTSIQTRPRTSATCATPCWATRSSGCCAAPDATSKFRTT
jgi:arginyl-tRNA synthetase